MLYAHQADNTKLFPSLRPGPSPLPCLRCGGAGTTGAAVPREHPLPRRREEGCGLCLSGGRGGQWDGVVIGAGTPVGGGQPPMATDTY